MCKIGKSEAVQPPPTFRAFVQQDLTVYHLGRLLGGFESVKRAGDIVKTGEMLSCREKRSVDCVGR